MQVFLACKATDSAPSLLPPNLDIITLQDLPSSSPQIFCTGLCPCYANPWHLQVAGEAAGNCWLPLRKKQHNPRIAGKAGFNPYYIWKSSGVKAPKSVHI